MTCSGSSGTIVRFVDRIDGSSEAVIQDYRWEIDSNAINIASESQPFIGDINGDFLEDVMFNQPGESDIMIAFQVPQEEG